MNRVVSLIVLLALVFAMLGGVIAQGDTHAFDLYFLHGAQALRAADPRLAVVMGNISALGSISVLNINSSNCFSDLGSRPCTAI